jgi:preprotein translocase subunit SecF
MKKYLMRLDFMAARHWFSAVSAVLVVASIALIIARGLNLGLDFTGGTIIEVHNPGGDIVIDDVRNALEGTPYSEATLQHFGSASDLVVRVQPLHKLIEDGEVADDRGIEADKVGLEVTALLQDEIPALEQRRVEFVGPAVGDELRDKSGTAMLAALIVILIYIGIRFTSKLGVSAVAALFHDVIIVLGAFALMDWQVDLTVLAAMLALIGYSINDSIVIADYVRDSFRNSRVSDPHAVVNDAIRKTLGRTINTALTTWLVVWALQIFGGPAVHGFALAMSIGVIVGTYSSIYIVCNLALSLKMNKEDFMLPEAKEVDDMP